MNNQANIITEFVAEILAECGISPVAHDYSKLMLVLEERVSARVFLAIIQSLTPDEAALVSNDIAAEKSTPDIVMEKIVKGAPHLQAVVARSLGVIHSELVNDFKNSTSSDK
jgi:hypothetical protein